MVHVLHFQSLRVYTETYYLPSAVLSCMGGMYKIRDLISAAEIITGDL